MFNNSKNVLVIAAHPDDEVLGCGGTIARHSDANDEVNILIVSEGLTSRQTKRDRSSLDHELSDLITASQIATSILGASSIDFLNFPDNRLDSLNLLDLIKPIEERICFFQPDLVYLHHAGDLNIDHRLLHQAVVTACRPTPHHVVKLLLSYEVQSSTDWQPSGSAPIFTPNWFVDISDTLDRKLRALHSYSSEMRQWPHSRSIKAVEHLARLRGSQVGVDAAEAFSLLRFLV